MIDGMGLGLWTRNERDESGFSLALGFATFLSSDLLLDLLLVDLHLLVCVGEFVEEHIPLVHCIMSVNQADKESYDTAQFGDSPTGCDKLLVIFNLGEQFILVLLMRLLEQLPHATTRQPHHPSSSDRISRTGCPQCYAATSPG